jgi:hypothetical protein
LAAAQREKGFPMTVTLGKHRRTAAAPFGLWHALRAAGRAVAAGAAAAERAHDRRRAHEAAGAACMRDTGMDPDSATGVPAWQGDLPFFMQAGFGRR